MFSSRKYLDSKTGPHGVDRFSYLQSLVTEFQDTNIEEAKEEVLANLANFAYDPINYEYFQQLNILDLFLDSLLEQNEKLIEFAIGGLCNASLDKQNKDFILKNDGVNLATRCLSSSNEETVLSSISLLMYLVTPASKKDIVTLPIVDAMLRFSESKNTRLSNLAQVFIEDYCHAGIVQEAKKAQQEWEAQMQAGTANLENIT